MIVQIHSTSRKRIAIAMILVFSVNVCYSFNSIACEKKNDMNTLVSTGLQPSNAPGSSDQSGDEWPMFHGSLNHTGTVTTHPLASGKVHLWIYTTGSYVWSAPAIVGDRLYVGSNDWNVYCLNATNGSKIWSFHTGAGVGFSSPAVVGNRVYVGSDNGVLYCLNAATGTLNWSNTTGGSIAFSSPVVASGRVYTGSMDHSLYCFNAISGTKIWSNTTGEKITYCAPAVASNRVYVGSHDNKTYCFDAISGTRLWNYKTGGTIESSPTIAIGRVYVGSNDHKLYCLNSTTGISLWNFTTGGGVTCCPAFSDGRIYIGSLDHEIYCLNATTGARAWNYSTGDAVAYSSPAVACGQVFVGSDDKQLYCLDAVTGKFLWNYSTTSAVFGSPSVANGRVCVGSNDHQVYGIGIIPIAPTAPQSLSITGGFRQVTLNWAAPVNDYGSTITGYRIYRGTTPGSETLLATIGNVLTFTDEGFGPVYYYRVSAVNIAGESALSNEVSAMIPMDITIILIVIIAGAIAGVVIVFGIIRARKKRKTSGIAPDHGVPEASSEMEK